jgi:tetratricopeptide (TPR) repeat protein
MLFVLTLRCKSSRVFIQRLSSDYQECRPMRLNQNFTQVLSCTMLLMFGSSSLFGASAQTAPTTANRALQPLLLRQCPVRFTVGETDPASIASRKQQLQAAQLVGNPGGGMLNGLGDIYRALGRYDEAIQAYQQSIAAAQAIDAPLLEAASLGGLSHTYVELGDYAQAATATERSLQLRRAANSPGLEALALNNRGIVNTLQGQFVPANENFQQGLALVPSLPFLRGNLGNLQYVTQGPTAALATYAQLPETLAPENKMALMNNRGLAYQALGQTTQAMQAYDAALTALTPTSNLSNTGCQWRILSNRGRLLAQQGKRVEAIAAYQQATTITTKIWQDAVSKLPLPQQQAYRRVIRPIYQEAAIGLIEQGQWFEAQALLSQIQPR